MFVVSADLRDSVIHIEDDAEKALVEALENVYVQILWCTSYFLYVILTYKI